MQRIEIPGPNREYTRLDRKGRRGRPHGDAERARSSCSPPARRRPTRRPSSPSGAPTSSRYPTCTCTSPTCRSAFRVPPVPPVPPVAPARPGRPPPAPPAFDSEGDVVRGDVAGDFLSTSGGDYRIGKVSGKVKILTHSGEIRVGGAGAGADLKTFGGDIVVGPVTGDLKASTLAGDIVGQTVTRAPFSPTPTAATCASTGRRQPRRPDLGRRHPRRPRRRRRARGLGGRRDPHRPVRVRSPGERHDPQRRRRRLARAAGRLQGGRGARRSPGRRGRVGDPFRLSTSSRRSGPAPSARRRR